MLKVFHTKKQQIARKETRNEKSLKLRSTHKGWWNSHWKKFEAKVVELTLHTTVPKMKDHSAIFPNLKNYKRKSVRDIGKAYLTDKKCAEFTKYIVNVIREELEWFE